MTAAGLSRVHWSQLRSARDALEHPSLAARMSSVLGTPIEEGMKLLPRTWYSKLSETTETVLYRTLEGAISTLPDVLDKPDVDRRHRNLSVLSGAIGGFFGIPGTLVELLLARFGIAPAGLRSTLGRVSAAIVSQRA